MQPVLLSVFSGARSTQLLIIFCQTSDLLAVVFPLQHHVAIPRSCVSKEPYDYNTNVQRVAVNLTAQRWVGFGRLAGSKLGWVRISA